MKKIGIIFLLVLLFMLMFCTVAFATSIDYQQLYTTADVIGGVKITGFNMTYFNTLPKDPEGNTLVNLVIPVQIGGKDVVEIDTFGSSPSSFYNKKVKGTLTFEDDSKVKKITNSAFHALHLTGDLILPNSIEVIEYNAFKDTKFDGKAKLPVNPAYTTIADSLFLRVPFTTLEGGIPSNVTTIEALAFSETNLTGELVIPDTVTRIGTAVDERGASFQKCEKLTKVTLSNNLTFLTQFLFQDCTELTEVIIPESSQITHIGMDVFANTKLNKFIVPDTVTNIHYTAFNGCNSLKWFYVGAENFVCDGNNTNRLFYGSNYPNLHIICKNETQAAYIKDRVYDSQDRYITYEKTVSFDGLDASHNRNVLYNFPINYKKADDYSTSKAWEVDSSYVLPSTPSGTGGWAFTLEAIAKITEDSKVTGTVLYAITPVPVVTPIFTISTGDDDGNGNIQKTYNGKAARMTVHGTLSDGSELKTYETAQTGEYFLLYNWNSFEQAYPFGPTDYTKMHGNTINSVTTQAYWNFTDVNTTKNGDYPLESGYRIRLHFCQKTADSFKYIQTYVARTNFKVTIDKATPIVTFTTTDAGNGTELSTLTSVAAPTDVGKTGTWEFKIGGTTHTTVQTGINNYDYTFTPTDSDNYNTVNGAITITGVEQRTVTFDPQGGIVSPTEAQVAVGGTLATLPTPTKDGYDFKGWFTQPNGQGTLFTTSTIVNEAITIFANWKAIPTPPVTGDSSTPWLYTSIAILSIVGMIFIFRRKHA